MIRRGEKSSIFTGEKPYRQCAYNVTLRRLTATIVAVEMQ